MNLAVSHLASREMLQWVIQAGRVLQRRAGPGSHQQEKKKSSWKESKSLGNDGFSLAELHEFLLAGLAAGQKENLSPVGRVK